MEDNESILGKTKVNLNDIKCDLSANDDAQKQALEQIAVIPAVSDALCSATEAPAVTHIHTSFAALVDNSEAYNTAVQCYLDEMKKFAKKLEDTFGKSNVMFLSYATKEDAPRAEHARSRRAAELKDVSKVTPINHWKWFKYGFWYFRAQDDDLNLAKVYDDNYPVIFNIILWFGVVIAFSLFAISYAIATMDPGRDSIIYRMTSTRIKKDN